MCTVFPTNKQNHPRAICPNVTNRPRTTSNETVGEVPMCPPECPHSGVSIREIGFVHYTLCHAGVNDGCALDGATRAGTQAPPLLISIIFFHAIPHKQNNHLHAIHPKEINRPCAIRSYQSPPNHAVCHYRVAVILSKAQGWQVQRSLPWVTDASEEATPLGVVLFLIAHPYHTRRMDYS